jgi:hypothetical protein
VVAPASLAEDEPFWESIRGQHRRRTTSSSWKTATTDHRRSVLENYARHARSERHFVVLRARSRWTTKLARHELARLLGCADAELIITRNTTESLDTVINGFDWKAGDEAVMAEQDYGSMLDMFKLQARRHGIVNRVVSVPMHPRSDDEIVDVYEKAITPKTRLLMVCHMINITGQILPVRRIVEMAHARGVQVMVDGAHTFGQLDFTIADLGGCDYYASSLHKWLGAPLGSGFLYVRRDRIAPLWQIFGDATFPDDDIRKLNHTGTHPAATTSILGRDPLPRDDRHRARVGATAVPAALLDREGPRRKAHRGQHTRGARPFLCDRQCRHRRDGAGRPCEGVVRQVPHLHGRHRRRRRAWRARDAAGIHDDGGARWAGEGIDRNRGVSHDDAA